MKPHIQKIKTVLLQNNTTGQRIFKNTFWLTCAEGISKLSSILITIWITKYLGLTDYGKFSFALSYVALFGIIIDFGFNTLVTREIAKNNNHSKKYIANIIIIKILLSIVIYFAIFLSSQSLNKTADTILTIQVLGLFIVAQSFFFFFHAIFRAYEKMEYEALSKFLNVVLLTLGVVIVILLNLGMIEISLAYFISVFVALIATVILLISKLTFIWDKISFNFIKKIIKDAWGYAFASLIMVLYFRIDVTMLSLMTNDERVGLYSAAYNIVLFMNIIPSVFLPSTFSILSKYSKTSNHKIKIIYKNSIKYLLLLSTILLILIVPLSGFIIEYVYGNEFKSAQPSLIILAFAGVILILDRIGVDLLNAIGRQRDTVSIFFVSVIFNILLNLVLIPKYYEIGSAIATVLTELLVLVLVYLKTKEYLTR